MIKKCLVFWCVSGFLFLALADSPGATSALAEEAGPSNTDWPLFALCMDTHDAKHRSLPEQAAMLHELGYAGCGHLWLNDVETRAQTLTTSNLRLFQVYLRVDLSKPQPLDEHRLAEALPALKPHHTQLALLITGSKPSNTSLDERAVKVINRIADLAKPYGVTVVLYPHQRHWLETTADAVRIAKKVNRPGEVGAMFNLCHWMLADPNRDLSAVLKEARPWLMAVTVNGSELPEKVRETRKGFIQPLGQGSYDIREILRLLRKIEYKGPIGLQCYGIGGDAKIHLQQSIETWRKVTSSK